MKKIFPVLLVILLLASCGAPSTETEKISLAGLKGPTSIGAVNGDFDLTVYGTADEFTPGLITGDVDIAMVPANLASVLYNKTNGAIKVAAVNTLGVLYVVSTDSSIKSVSDLEGKTILSTGKGTTPEYVLNYILSSNNVTANVEYKSEATEIAALLSSGEGGIAVLPQPYVTAVTAKNPDVKVVLSLTDEWNKISDTQLVTGVLVVRTDWLNENEKAFKQFLKDYAESIGKVSSDLNGTAAKVVDLGIIASVDMAKAAIPACNIVYYGGDEMKAMVANYLNVLFERNAASVGGKLPGEDFYYIG